MSKTKGEVMAKKWKDIPRKSQSGKVDSVVTRSELNATTRALVDCMEDDVQDLDHRFAAIWKELSERPNDGTMAILRQNITDSFSTCYQDFLVAVSDIRKKQADLEEENKLLRKRINRLRDVAEDHVHGADGRALHSPHAYLEEDY